MGSDRAKLTNCDKVEWGEKYHYASDILFEKVTSYEKFGHNLTLIVQIVWKISVF